MSKAITFTGGLGAQIFSASGYFYLEAKGEAVSAYTGYFDSSPHIAKVGKLGDMSHWSWELEEYGLFRNSFIKYSQNAGQDLIWDGPEKLRLGFLGLQNIAIRDKFPIHETAIKTIKSMFNNESYACVHIRRGDYLNVATHIIQDDVYIRALRPIVSLVKNILIISDTPLTSELIYLLKNLPCNIVTAIGGSPHTAHGLMRMSDILICSNSQLSYTAGALRSNDKLTFFPTQHDGDLMSYTNTFIRSLSEFQLLTTLG